MYSVDIHCNLLLGTATPDFVGSTGSHTVLRKNTGCRMVCEVNKSKHLFYTLLTEFIFLTLTGYWLKKKYIYTFLCS